MNLKTYTENIRLKIWTSVGNSTPLYRRLRYFKIGYVKE
jgi:hypothetical protein